MIGSKMALLHHLFHPAGIYCLASMTMDREDHVDLS